MRPERVSEANANAARRMARKTAKKPYDVASLRRTSMSHVGVRSSSSPPTAASSGREATPAASFDGTRRHQHLIAFVRFEGGCVVLGHGG